MRAKELAELSTEELLQRLRELKARLFRLRMAKATGKLEQPHLFRETRREVARVKTILRKRGMKL